MTEDCRQALLPCRKCGSTYIEMWDGRGTFAEMNCRDCGNSESLQVTDVLGVNWYEKDCGFNTETASYSPQTVALARDSLIQEWNTRASAPAPEVTEEMVERAAIYWLGENEHSWNAGLTEDDRDSFRQRARAALQAALNGRG